MFDKLSVWRLRHFADECRRARELSLDPMTMRELAEFEHKFRELATELETAIPAAL
jgi:hypothetical protein